MNPDIFWQVFAAVICANLLTALCVWGMVQYSRLEREGRAADTRFPIYCAMFVPIVFAAIAVYSAMGGH